MRRHKHSLSHYRLLTADMGKLIPIACMEALPGDTFQQATSLLLRMSPLQSPVMHPVTVRVHHWFVPNRLLWDDWEDFITGGPDGTGPATPYPSNTAPGSIAIGTVGDYLGLPTGVTFPAGALALMPFRGYNLIFNEWYRDEDLVTEAGEDDGDIRQIAWEKDYFTRARPWAQKGPDVTLPLGGTADVVGDGTAPSFIDTLSTAQNLQTTAGFATTNFSGNMLATGAANWGDPHLQADLSTATATNIRDVRLAFALQRYQEARAQYGSRYTEYLRYLGIRPSDARLQRPEYLGGGKQTVAFSEVLRTGNDQATATADEPVGQLLGHGIAALRSNRYRYFCEEHGYVYTLLSVRPRTMYQDGLPRSWSRRTKEDYYQRELELIGQQEIKNSEIFADGTAADDDTFGYQDRYSEYRHLQSGVSGEFRTTLDYWHLGRKFAARPALNASFVECDPSKRIFSEQTNNSMWIMANHSVQVRRLLGKRTIGRVI